MTPQGRGALAGAVAAALWTAADPLFKRAFGTPYSDAEVLSAFVTRGRAQRIVGLVLHSGNGAVFGWLFGRLGGRGATHGVVAALAENTLLWPVMPLVDRVHPNRRDGTWPPLARNGRVFAQATAAHACFGAVLGLLGPRAGAPRT